MRAMRATRRCLCERVSCWRADVIFRRATDFILPLRRHAADADYCRHATLLITLMFQRERFDEACERVRGVEAIRASAQRVTVQQRAFYTRAARYEEKERACRERDTLREARERVMLRERVYVTLRCFFFSPCRRWLLRYITLRHVYAAMIDTRFMSRRCRCHDAMIASPWFTLHAVTPPCRHRCRH